tara:strand:- start:3618 stop:5342 length:1725 start_codon:yes stop_codon:yes gene_type:complete
MKKSLLFVVGLLFAASTSAQVIFSGEEPAAIQGAYDMTYAEPAGGWGVPDLLDPNNAVQDTLVQLFDNSAADSLGCNAAINGVDLTDQIAILFRGDCEFGTKALNAENAGAIACVIINNVPGGPVGMAPGTDGANVTIPLVMIGLTDGQLLLDEMQNGPVEVFIGNKTGFYPNDIGTQDGQVLRSQSASVPALLAQDASEFSVDMGAMVYNYGFQNSTNVTLTATVDFGGSNIYSETSTPEDIAAGDSSFIQLPTFSQASYPVGTYEVTYTIDSDSTDNYDFDNTIEADFQINDSLFTYASIVDTSGAPNQSGGFRPSTNNSTYSACVVFQDPNASRVAPEGMTFSAIKGADATVPSLEGEPMSIVALQWNDQFTDLNDANLAFNDVQEIAFFEYTYPSDLSGEPVTAYFEEPFALQDNQRYLFCVQTFNTEVFIGFDPTMDYTRNVNTYLQPVFPIESDGTYSALGFGEDAVPGVGVNFIDAALLNVKDEQLAIDMNAYPSPVSEVLNVNFKGYDVDRLELVNLTGQVVAAQTVQTGAKSTKVDVNNLENGVYIVNVYLTNGMTETMQVVVNH